MKKLLVVLSALFLIVAFAVPVMASDTEISGEFRVGFTGDTASLGKLEFDVSAAVDDYNTVEFEFDAEQSLTVTDVATGEDTSFLEVDAAYFKLITDIGAAFDLPVGLTMTNGYFEPGTEDYEGVTDLGYEDNVDGDIEFEESFLGHQLSFGFGPANLNVAFGVGESDDGFDFLGTLDVPEVGPASFELYYEVDNNDEFEGAVGVEGAATVGPADVGVGFEYNLNTETWAYGFGVSAGFAPLTVGLGLNGDDEETLNQLGVDLTLAPTEDYGLNAGLGFSFADGTDAFQGVEVSGYYNIGAAEFRLGYLYNTDLEDFSYYAPVLSSEGGGPFVRFDIDF